MKRGHRLELDDDVAVRMHVGNEVVVRILKKRAAGRQLVTASTGEACAQNGHTLGRRGARHCSPNAA
jgi:hypothetical protein